MMTIEIKANGKAIRKITIVNQGRKVRGLTEYLIDGIHTIYHNRKDMVLKLARNALNVIIGREER